MHSIASIPFFLKIDIKSFLTISMPSIILFKSLLFFKFSSLLNETIARSILSISSKDSGKCICGEKALVAGPLWTGKLWDSELVDKMAAKNTFIDLNNFFETIRGEYKLDVVGFYHIGKVAKKYKIGGLPKKKVIMDRIKEKGFSVAETHFDREGIRSEVGIKELIQIIKK